MRTSATVACGPIGKNRTLRPEVPDHQADATSTRSPLQTPILNPWSGEFTNRALERTGNSKPSNLGFPALDLGTALVALSGRLEISRVGSKPCRGFLVRQFRNCESVCFGLLKMGWGGGGWVNQIEY